MNAQPTLQCIVNREEILVVLQFDTNDGEANWKSLQQKEGVLSQVSNAFRKEAAAAGIRVSGYQGSTLMERIHGGCLFPLHVFTDKSKLPNDPSCMSAVARRLDAQWLLSGFVDPFNSRYDVQAQLISATEPLTHRSVKVSFSSDEEVPSQIHAAWLQLVAVP